MTCRRRYLAFSYFLALAVLSQNAFSFGLEKGLRGVPHHYRITESAAASKSYPEYWPSGQPFGKDAARLLAWNNLALDEYLNAPLNTASGNVHKFMSDEMENLHFDNLNSAKDIDRQYTRYFQGALYGLIWAADAAREGPDVAIDHPPFRDDKKRYAELAALNIIGVLLHAVQDLHSHSTWINDPSRREQAFGAQAQESIMQTDGSCAAAGCLAPWSAPGCTAPWSENPIGVLWTGAYENGSINALDRNHGSLALIGSVRYKPGINLDRKGRSEDAALLRGTPELEEILKKLSPQQKTQLQTFINKQQFDQVLSVLGESLDKRRRDLGLELFVVARKGAERETAYVLGKLEAAMYAIGGNHKVFWDDLKKFSFSGLKFWTRGDGPSVPSDKVGLLFGWRGSFFRALSDDHYRDMPYGFVSGGTYARDGDPTGWHFRVAIKTDEVGGDHPEALVSLRVIGENCTANEMPLGDRQHSFDAYVPFKEGELEVFYVGPAKDADASVPACSPQRVELRVKRNDDPWRIKRVRVWAYRIGGDPQYTQIADSSGLVVARGDDVIVRLSDAATFAMLKPLVQLHPPETVSVLAVRHSLLPAPPAPVAIPDMSSVEAVGVGASAALPTPSKERRAEPLKEVEREPIVAKAAKMSPEFDCLARDGDWIATDNKCVEEQTNDVLTVSQIEQVSDAIATLQKKEHSAAEAALDALRQTMSDEGTTSEGIDQAMVRYGAARIQIREARLDAIDALKHSLSKDERNALVKGGAIDSFFAPPPEPDLFVKVRRVLLPDASDSNARGALQVLAKVRKERSFEAAKEVSDVLLDYFLADHFDRADSRAALPGGPPKEVGQALKAVPPRLRAKALAKIPDVGSL